jgi:hypothetical protein
LKKNITFQVAKSIYETQKKNCYQQPIFELINKKMQLLSSFNFGIWRHSRLVTRLLDELSVKGISIAVSASNYLNEPSKFPLIFFNIKQQTQFSTMDLMNDQPISSFTLILCQIFNIITLIIYIFIELFTLIL